MADETPSVAQARKQALCPHGEGYGHGYRAGGRYCDDCGLWWRDLTNAREVALDAYVASVRAESRSTLTPQSLLIALRNRRMELVKLGWTERLKELQDIYDMIEAWEAPRSTP